MPETANPKLRRPDDLSDAPRVEAPPYAELNVASNFSLLRGASHADELVGRAAELGYRAMGIADRNTLAGVVRAHQAAKEAGLRLVVGARVVGRDAPPLLLWAIDRAGYGRLCRLLTLGKRRTEKGHCDLALSDIAEHAAGLHAAIDPPHEVRGEDWRRALGPCREAFGDRLSLLAEWHYRDDDDARLAHLADLAARQQIALLAGNAVLYHDPARRPLQDVLTCIRHHCTIAEAGHRLCPNAERHLKPPAVMRRLYEPIAPDAIDRALHIADECRFSLDELRYEYPHELIPAGLSAAQYLAELTWAGAARRYPQGLPEKVHQQLQRELGLIAQLKFEPYFLTCHDLVNFARSRGILCQGRGSAANSAVCFCLGITSVDPGRLDLLFERFISSARNEPPDIDIDFEHERREEVIQYLYQRYGRERAGLTAEVISYRGRSAVRDVGKALGLSLDMVDAMAKKLDWWHRGRITPAQAAEAGLDPNDATVGRVIELSTELLGFPRHLSQHVGGMVMTQGPLCELVPIENAAMADRTVIEWDKDDIDALGILKVDVLGLGMLTCLSRCLELIKHECKMNTGEAQPTEAKPAPAEPGPANAPRTPPGRHGAAARYPGLRAGAPRRPLYDLADIPAEDPAVYDMICAADTVGVFQVESRAQMSMLPRLRPRCFYDLVIEVAIVRPGPIQGNMVHPYLRRRNGEEQVDYPSEALREVLHKTLGVPLFQEQAMRVAMVGAGFSGAEADQLRRAMAAWKRHGGLEVFHRKIVDGMLANGYTQDFAERSFLQIRGFGEYGFPESHAASFALLVYASAWLKRYHPAAFAAALLNSQPMGFYAPAQIVRDAKEHGVEVRPVDVNHSQWDCTLESRDEGEATSSGEAAPTADRGADDKRTWGAAGPAIRLGFRMLKGLKIDTAERVVRARAGRPYTGVGPLQARAGLSTADLRLLAEADALRSLVPRGLSAGGSPPKGASPGGSSPKASPPPGLSRRQALWQVLKLSDEPSPLFAEWEKQTAEGPSAARLPTMPERQEVMTDYSTVGLSLKRHPVALVRDELAARGIITCADAARRPHRSWVRVAGLVLNRQRPATASGIVFATLEDESGIANLIIRAAVYERYRAAARHGAMIHAEGYIERKGEVVHLMTKRLFDLSYLIRGVEFKSRDFH